MLFRLKSILNVNKVIYTIYYFFSLFLILQIKLFASIEIVLTLIKPHSFFFFFLIFFLKNRYSNNFKNTDLWLVAAYLNYFNLYLNTFIRYQHRLYTVLFTSNNSSLLALIWKTLSNKAIMWNTIFKRHSIFGFFKASRQTFTSLRSEESNFIKF